MSNDVGKYLGPHKQLGPGSYELGPIPVVGKWQSGVESGGGYTGLGRKVRGLPFRRRLQTSCGARSLEISGHFGRRFG